MPDLSYATTRFFSALATIAGGAVITVSAWTLTPQTVRWVSFAVAAALIVVIAVAFATPGRGAVQRVLDLPLVLICAWAVVDARVIQSGGAGASPHAIKWFTFASGAAICTLGIVGLLLHERGHQRDLRWAAERIWVTPDFYDESPRHPVGAGRAS